MSLFIINTLLFSGIYYSLYALLFRKWSFLQLNRTILLCIPLLSIGIPIIAPFFKDPVLTRTGFSTTLLPEVVINDMQPHSSGIPYANPVYLLWIYLAGFVFSLIPFVFGFFKVYHIIRQSHTGKLNEWYFRVSSQTDSPFAFFRSIIIPMALKDHPNLNAVLKHEEVHSRQLHSIDNIYYNLLGIVFWFNPFIHLLKRELRQTHECLADQKALEETSREVYARMLLSSTFDKEWSLPMTISTVNPFFNSSLLKTRITMMYKKESPQWLRFTYWVLLPLAVAMTLHACNKTSEKNEDLENEAKAITFAEVEQPPLFSSCDPAASADDQKVCFQQGIVKHLQDHIEYPEQAKLMGLEGKVFVEFVISKTGEVTQVNTVRRITLPEDASREMKEAARQMENRALLLVADLPTFKPAQLNGKDVAMKFVLPIGFKLS
ncbi:MAG TPA: hypothetical protein DCG19_03540 [Cryomorphaceae bacterium]|nr:hypothetical protein [Owenweeksia sp.]MBF97477.1 hypothetical protein [Owenweeksia sp.]HAD96452.1 hypothetical protein [Cryomorphaceae bacterium]HCQ15659.1 hypothetical protein [Cryomorphaceae bacterium]|tara:strand:+ start:22445 stop:23746 length:1302 start_codon:yes stop_codon:yes gene_type:complete